MNIKIRFVINLCTYLFLLNVDLCIAKICDKLNPVNVDLQCSYNGKSIACDEYSELQSNTTVRPTCKPKYKYFGSPPKYTEIKCNNDGKWDNSLSPCIPECGKPYAKPDLLISGGVVQNIGSHPWHVAIYNLNEVLICGGTIITPQLVLSAAHCFVNTTTVTSDPRIDDYSVVVSKFSRNYKVKDNDYQKTFKIADIRFSERGFFGHINNFGSDIVILILNDTITLGPTTLPACIDWSGVKGRETPTENTPGRVAGWGLNDLDKYGENLTTADLPFISHKRCLNMVPHDFKSFITYDKFCAGLEGGPSVRQGDSGGGLLFKRDDIYYLRGIVSLKQPTVTSVAAFTDIADHLDWIIAVRNEIEQQPYKEAFEHYDTLYNQINGTTEDDIMKLYDISNGLQNEVIDGKNITTKLNSQARSLFDLARAKMQTLTADKISEAFLKNQLAAVSTLASKLVDTCYQCFNEIIDDVIERLTGKMNIKEILVLVRQPNGFCCIPELISIYTSAYHKLRRNGELNTHSIIQLAYHIKELMDWENFANVDPSERSQMSNIKNKLPKSVKNIVFSTKLCMRNVRFHEYLFSPKESEFSHDQDRRYVFTWNKGDRYDPYDPDIFFWKLERNGDQYEIINSQFNEHLYAEINGSLPVEGTTRPVLTWKKTGSRSGSSWILEPEGDYVFIKNVDAKEYFFAALNNKRTEERRFVYTFVHEGKTYDSKWEMIDCDDFASKVKSEIKDPTKKLPNSVKNMAFSTKICIRNVYYNEYLYASGPSQYWYDDNRRNVFTWRGGNGYGPGESGKFAWTLQRNDESSDEFQIVNSQFNEHLYAEVDGSLLDGHRRYVLTWRKGGSRAGSSWKFEHDGDNVYLRNAHNGEYLFADNTKKRDDDRRSVFTFIVGSKTNDSQWEFIDCDNTVSDTGYQTEDTKVKPAKQLSLLSNSSSASPKVCIRNVRYNEYLFVEGPSTYWYDQNTRYVLTKKGGEKYDANEPGKFVWILERTNDYYQIINLQYKEHLFADINGSLPIESHRRHILSWRKGGQRTGSTWKLEPEGDYVYIKNVYNNEYLFADFDKKRDEDRRMVFSFIFGGKTEDSKWELIDCSNLQSEVQSQIKDITKKVSNSLKNIVFAAHVCIKSTFYNEYLYAAGSPTHWYDQDRRNVFTWKGGERYGPDERSKFAWKLERNEENDEFQIINYQFNEHLYAEIDGPSPELDYCRYVFTWRKNSTRLGSWWKFEHEGDQVFIKNAHNNEYLFAACCNNERDEERRLVFTFVRGGKTADSKWEIVDCSTP